MFFEKSPLACLMVSSSHCFTSMLENSSTKEIDQVIAGIEQL